MGKRGKNGRKQNRPARAQATTARVLLVVLRDLETTTDGEAKLETVFWLMSQFGKVEKISLFTSQRDCKEQVLVQYETHETASLAMEYLNGRDIEATGVDDQPWKCTFVIVFSTVPELSFKKENENNQTYEELNTSIEEKERTSPYNFLWGEQVAGDGWLVPRQEDEMKGQIPKCTSSLPPGKVGTCIYLSGLPDPPNKEEPIITADMLFRVGSQYGKIVAAKVLSHNAKKAIIQFHTEEDAERMRRCFDSFGIFGKKITTAKSTLPNASNWSGVLSEKLMYSLRNEEPSVEAESKVSPSRAVIVYEWDVLEKEVYAVLAAHGLDPPTLVTPGQEGGGAILEWGRREEPFKLCGWLNGIEIDVGSDTIKARCYFTNPILQSPAEAGLEPADEIMPIDSLLLLLSMADFLTELRLTRYTEKLKEEGYDYAQQLVGVERSSLEEIGVRPVHVDIILKALSQKNDSCSVAKEKRSQTEPTRHWGQDVLQGPRSNTCPVNGVVQTSGEWCGGLFTRASARQSVVFHSQKWEDTPVVDPTPASSASQYPTGNCAPPSIGTIENETFDIVCDLGGGDNVLDVIPEIESSRSGSECGDDMMSDLLDVDMVRETKTLDEVALCAIADEEAGRRSRTLDIMASREI